MKVSIIIPAYNEERTIRQIVDRVQAVPLPGLDKEIVVVDDGSRDKTADILKEIPGVAFFRHEKNRGKGGALKTGIARATGDVMLIQDADLEYDPSDYAKLLEPILSGKCEFVMGTRFLEHGPKFFTKNGDPFFSHYVGNRMIIWLTNVLYGQGKSDYESCYKVFTKSLARSFSIETDGFAFDNELICKALRLGYRLVEVQITYSPRLYSEGKKIKWWDGLVMLWTIVKWRFLPIR